MKEDYLPALDVNKWSQFLHMNSWKKLHYTQNEVDHTSYQILFTKAHSHAKYFPNTLKLFQVISQPFNHVNHKLPNI